MPTSSLFYKVKITDIPQAKRFAEQMEESYKESKGASPCACNVVVETDIKRIRDLMQ